MKKLIFCWHIHHNVLLEYLTEPFKNRVKYIKENKPFHEVELRLRLFKKVKGVLPPISAEWKKAYAERQKAYAEWQKACAEWQKKYKKEIEELHKKECLNCPWRNGSIFPSKGRKRKKS